jgi:hypothetical protein
VLTCGTPAGLGGQYFWTRTAPVQRKKRDRRKTEDKETHHWLKVMEQVRQTFSKEAACTRPWFQIDAGGDAWPVLWEAVTRGDLLTVRAAHDRRLVGTFKGEQDYLWPHLERQTPDGYYQLEVPPADHRQGRMATMQIQWAPVERVAKFSEARMTGLMLWRLATIGATSGASAARATLGSGRLQGLERLTDS